MFIDIKLMSSELSSNDVPIKSNDKNSRIVKESSCNLLPTYFLRRGGGGSTKKKMILQSNKTF